MQYLIDTLGIKIEYENLNNMNNFPYLLTDRYDFKLVRMEGIKTVFMYVKRDMDTISSIKKHILKVKQKIGLPVVLILKSCLPRQRKSLIDARISFVVEGKQIYLPFMGAVLQEKYQTEKINTSFLSPSAQALLFYYIYSKEKEMYMNFVARSFDLSAMTISRAIKQLESLGLFRTYKNGVNKIFTSNYSGPELYDKAKKYLQSPIKKKVYVDKIDIDEDMLYAGYSALSEYSMLSVPRMTIYAADKIDIESYETYLNDTENQVEIEIWRYNPRILADSDCVDILSLYQSLKDDADDRVQGEIKNMFKKFWEDYK